MKKKLIALMLGTALCATCLTACGNNESPNESTVSVEEEITSTEETTDVSSQDSTEEAIESTEENVSDNEEAIVEDTESTVSENEITESTEEEEYDPYAGLAVSNCHDVTLPVGVSYNDAITEVVKGTSAYPDTYPNIYDVDFNTPGVYNCYWERLQEDGTYLPLNYATFTVTIYDPNAPVTN